MTDTTSPPGGGSRIARINSPALRALALAIRPLYARLLAWRKSRARAVFHHHVHESYRTALMDAVGYIVMAKTKGDVAEFGVHGITAEMIVRHLDAYDQNRGIHLFDSFQGHPALKPEDMTSAEALSGSWSQGSSHAPVSADQLRQKLRRIYSLGPVRVYEGFFEQTLGRISPDTRFSLVVMDCNLLSSNRAVLDHIFSHGHVAEGAMFLFSSWNASQADPEQSARKAWAEAVERFGIVVSDAGYYNWGGKKFIVHGYRPVAGQGV